MSWIRTGIALFGVSLMGCATFEAGAPAGHVNIIAHRGASAYAPENTLASFQKAIELRAHWFELDCTLTKDGEVVVIHDNTLARTTGGVQGHVGDFTLAQLKRYDVGSWFDPKFAAERFPSLAETLDLAKGKIGVYIEIKNSDDDTDLMRQILDAYDSAPMLPDHRADLLRHIEASDSRNLELTRNVIALVRERSMQKQIVLQSFSPIVCAVALIEAPELRTELLAASSDRDPLQWSRFLEWNKRLVPNGFNPNKDDVTRTLVTDLHANNQTIAVWTVDDPQDMRDLVDLGVNSLITNKPDLALKVTSGD